MDRRDSRYDVQEGYVKSDGNKGQGLKNKDLGFIGSKQYTQTYKDFTT